MSKRLSSRATMVVRHSGLSLLGLSEGPALHVNRVEDAWEPTKYDPTFRGPIRNRSCTDIICCILFMVFIVGYMVVGILAWLYGDPREVIYPRNSTGMYCGIGGNTGKPYVFYFDILKCASPTGILASALNGLQCPTTQVCVATCPDSFKFPVTAFVPGVTPRMAFEQKYCNPAIDLETTKLTPKEILAKELCPAYMIPSTPLIILAVMEVIILLLLIFLRKRILIAIALIKEASKAIAQIMSSLVYPLVTFILLVICVSYWGMTALYLATSGEPLYRVVNLGKDKCDSVTGNETCHPMNYNISKYDCEGAKCVFYKYNDEGILQRNLFNLQIYNIIGFLWCMNFVIALGQCTLAGAFASYYWAFDKPKDIPYFAVSGAFMRTLRYHTGSLAFGALILTIIQLIRIILEYLDHKLKNVHNPLTRFLMCCLKCCFWCLEKFIKFLNRNAYIMIAVYGKNFCVSAKNAFKLLMRNVVRVVVLDKITDLLLFFGKLLVVGGVGVLAFFFFTGRIKIPDPNFEAPVLNYYWLPILTLVVGSYMIAQGFFSVYNMCVDTLFLCFLEDLERNDGSQVKPYYMSKSLMKIFNKKNKGPKTEEKK
uniref:choline transporter-like protein 4 n=1 Tax=Pristiophorus japonicus TaxID=55135 RepID=UPI00398F6FE2